MRLKLFGLNVIIQKDDPYEWCEYKDRIVRQHKEKIKELGRSIKQDNEHIRKLNIKLRDEQSTYVKMEELKKKITKLNAKVVKYEAMQREITHLRLKKDQYWTSWRRLRNQCMHSTDERLRSCGSKKVFTTVDEAHEFIQETKKAKHAYHCHHCHLYHVTNKEPANEQNA